LRIRESNVIVKKPRKDMLRVALLFPSTYEASLSNLFVHMAYYFLNKYSDIYVERFTLSNPQRSLETKTLLKNFDIILTSLPFELMYQDFIKILILNGIEPLREVRGLGKPLIIAGGPAVTANPLPVLDIVDAVIIGEGERLLEELSKLVPYKDRPKEILENLMSLSEVLSGWYPKDEVIKYYVEDLDREFYPIIQIQSDVEPVYGKGFLMEVSRGCPHLCSFCLETHVFYPYRFRSYGNVKKMIYEGLKENSLNRVVFYSLSFFDYKYSVKLLEDLITNGVSFNVPSLRLDTLSSEKVELIKAGGQKTVTIAPETLSDRLGCLIRKKFGYELVKEIVKCILSKGLNVKLYFIIGLPGESLNDVMLIPKLINEVIKELGIKGKRIHVTVNPFIPKANTPMQYYPMERIESLRNKMKLLTNLLPRDVVDVDTYDPRWATIQAFISLGDRELSKLLVLWAKYGGGLSGWRRAVKELSYDVSYVFKPRDPHAELPWSFIDLGLTKYLSNSYLAISSCID